MTPDSLRRMVVYRAFSHAMLATKLGRGMLQPHVHAPLVVEAFDTGHMPWSWRGEDVLVKGHKIH